MAEPKHLGKYEILEEIGRGGFAVVYQANDGMMDRQVALKVIHNVHPDEGRFVQRFQQEARIAASLSHPNIVPVYEFGEADGVLYVAMALIGEGRTLRDLMTEQQPLCLEHALSILDPLANALDYLHRRDPPLIHRDVKPSNVLLQGEGDDAWVVLTDFGLVRSLEASAELTKSGTILGTPAYLAPEQADPKRWGDITSLTDIYALGVIVYEMLVGRQPFVGDFATVFHAHVYEMPPSPLELVPDLGEDLNAVLLHALAKPPAERYPSAGALMAALREVAATRRAAAQRGATLEQLETQAQELLNAGEWLEALDQCTQMVRLDPDWPSALDMLTAAKEGLDQEQAKAARRRHMEERYEEGLRSLKEKKWTQAIAALEEVAKGNPDFRDVQEKLKQAHDEFQYTQWYDEAVAYISAEHWEDACRIWVRLLRLCPDYQDGDAILHLLDSTNGLTEQVGMLKAMLLQRQHQVEIAHQALTQYSVLAEAIEQEDWENVVKVGDWLIQEVPNLGLPQSWLIRARRALLRLLRSWLAQSGLETMEPRVSISGPIGDTIVWEQDGKEMARVPAGEFLYGNKKKKMELPEFWIDKTPVTNAEYARFVAATGHEPPTHWEGKNPPKEIVDHPVVNVSWHDAMAYAKWAGKRLPTEEEWEKAARGTDGREYPWGGREEGRCNTKETGIRSTTAVGQYSPDGDSPFGCVDMAGNVWEWTAFEEGDRRVVRGGSWHSILAYAYCAGRVRDNPRYSSRYYGFRCVSPV